MDSKGGNGSAILAQGPVWEWVCVWWCQLLFWCAGPLQGHFLVGGGRRRPWDHHGSSWGLVCTVGAQHCTENKRYKGNDNNGNCWHSSFIGS